MDQQSFTPKSFWQRPEGKTGVVFGIGILAGLGYLLYNLCILCRQYRKSDWGCKHTWIFILRHYIGYFHLCHFRKTTWWKLGIYCSFNYWSNYNNILVFWCDGIFMVKFSRMPFGSFYCFYNTVQQTESEQNVQQTDIKVKSIRIFGALIFSN